MAVAIDNRSVPRKAVLPQSSTSEATRHKVDTNDVTRKTYLFSEFLHVDMAFRPTL